MNLFVLLFTLVTGILAEVPINVDYHSTIGIPLAARIKAAEEADRITGGRPAALGNHPHFGGLIIHLTNGRQSLCGSSLLSTTRSVTAAHCWLHIENQAHKFTVVLGSTTLYQGGTRRDTSDVKMHPQWDPSPNSNLNNDIAIIRFSPVTLTNVIQPINLPVDQTNNMFVGVWASAAGFGLMGDGIDEPAPSPYLNEVELLVISNEKCASIWGPEYVNNAVICIDGSQMKSTCGGDSGGPLAVMSNQQRILIGLTSFGYRYGCQKGYPAVFTRITSHLSWIQGNL